MGSRGEEGTGLGRWVQGPHWIGEVGSGVTLDWGGEFGEGGHWIGEVGSRGGGGGRCDTGLGRWV